MSVRELTIRAQYNATVARLLEKTYGFAEGTVYYIPGPYDEPAKPAAVPEEATPKGDAKRGGRRRKL